MITPEMPVERWSDFDDVFDPFGKLVDVARDIVDEVSGVAEMLSDASLKSRQPLQCLARNIGSGRFPTENGVLITEPVGIRVNDSREVIIIGNISLIRNPHYRQ